MTVIFSISNILKTPLLKPAAKYIPFGHPLKHKHASFDG
jgi:hypothetical protein